MGQLGDEICRGRCHQDRVGLTAQLDVRHVVVDAGIEGIGVDRIARQCLEGDGTDETGGGLGHHYLHLGAGTAQIAHQLGGLVGGHAAGHAQHQASAGQRGRWQALLIRGGGRPGVVGGGGRVGRCVHGGHGRGLPAVPGSTVEGDSLEREALPAAGGPLCAGSATPGQASAYRALRGRSQGSSSWQISRMAPSVMAQSARLKAGKAQPPW